MADERCAKYKFLAILSSTGLLSGLVVDCLIASPAGKHMEQLGFMGFAIYELFGAILGGVLAANEMLGLEGIWKAFLLPMRVAVAYFFRAWSRLLSNLAFPTGEIPLWPRLFLLFRYSLEVSQEDL